MAITYSDPGQYTLGGISAPRTGVAKAFQAGMSANLGRQTTRQEMKERDQAMKLRAIEEQRKAQLFKLGLQDRAAAKAARGRSAGLANTKRAAMASMMEGLTAIGTPTASVGAIAPIAPPGGSRSGLFMPQVPLTFGTKGSSVPPVAPTGNLSMSIPAVGPAGGAPVTAGLTLPMGMPPTATPGVLPTVGPAGVQVASLDPMSSFQMPSGKRPDLFGGGVDVADASGTTPTGALPEVGATRVDFRGIPLDVYPDGRIIDAETGEELPKGGDFDALRAEIFRYSGVGAGPEAVSSGVFPDASKLLQSPTAQTLPAGPLSAGEPIRVELGNIPFDVYPDGQIANALTNTELPDTEDFDTLRSALIEKAGLGPSIRSVDPSIRSVDPNAPALVQDVQGMLRQSDISGALRAIQEGLDTGRYGPMANPLGRAVGYVADDPEEAALRTTMQETAQWFRDPANKKFMQENPDLLLEAAHDPVRFVAGQRAGGETAAAEALAAEEAVPTVDTLWGGLQPNFGTPVQLTFGETNGEASKVYVAAPERVLQDVEIATRKQQQLQLLATYYQQTNNAKGLIEVRGQLDVLGKEQQYLEGMMAIIGVQRQNFGPAQQILQRGYPGRQIELRPYTDGTLELFVDGERAVVEGTGEYRPTWSEFAGHLQITYDEGYIAQQQKIAEQQQELSATAFEITTKAAAEATRDVAKFENEAALKRAMAEGELDILNADAGIGNMIVDGAVVPVQLVEIVEGSGADQTVRYVVRRIGTDGVK